MPFQTEMNRALRLLGIDVTFLQSAQNPMTVQKRQAQMRQRLRQLLDFSRELRTTLTQIATKTSDSNESDQLE
jgi:signal recognition particle subunit SEC65